MGAWVAALVLGFSLAAASVARADDGVTLTRFKVPNRAAVDKLNAMGADLAESLLQGPNGSYYVDAVVTPDQKAMYQALGYEPIVDLQNDATVARVRHERDAALQAERDAFANLKAGHARAKRAAATDDVEPQRADYFQNYAGRYISIEGWTSGGGAVLSGRGYAYTGPTLTAEWLDAAGNQMGSGTLSPFVDDGKYLYHTQLFRVGAANDGGAMPASIRIASSDGGVATLKVKEWTSTNGSGEFPAGFRKDFNTHYVDPVETYQKIKDLAAEYPNIAHLVTLPDKTPGYQRHAQAVVGTSTPYNGGTSTSSRNPSISASDQNAAVVVTSLGWGQDGGNQESVQLVAPTGASQPLAVTVSGNAITVKLASDSDGAVSSTAAQVIAAINASPDASRLVTADSYHNNAGAGIVTPGGSPTMLQDYLHAPADYPRGPQTQYMLRIGKPDNDTKTGVFIYCQEHAREWATPLVCLETAQRLLVNYSTDDETTKLVDNLDIYILPVVNADGAMFSMYDYNFQRKNMVDYCGTSNDSPVDRNTWGVDLNRNFDFGSIFDGYEGASTNCISEVFAGPFEHSEPEVTNESWIQTHYSNIKFAMNVHSYGGYFMWPPGAYKTEGRVTLPYPSYGTQQYFQQTADTVLDRIKSYRGTAVLPSRTGPVADVLYSAAGNSADEAWYDHGIVGYDFEIGADRFSTSDSCTPPGTPTAEDPPLRCLSGVGFQPDYATEGHGEGMEFANGNYALLESALDYQNDTTPPTVTPVSSTGSDISPSSYSVTFNQSEAADIYYTTDGSTPTTSSPQYQPSRPRGLPTPIPIVGTTTLRWLAKDFKGNVSTGSKTFYVGGTGTVGGTVPATLALALGPPASFGPFTPGVSKVYDTSTTATVTSTAGDALLTVSDPDTAHPGHLVNGSFFLAQQLQMKATDPNTANTAFNSIGSSYNLLGWGAPVSSDPVTLWFEQSIGAGEALRTGTYAKTLTFTLSTTNP